MKQKIYEPARHNEESPAPGMAAVNTFNPEEEQHPLPENAVPEKEKETRVAPGAPGISGHEREEGSV